MIGMEEKISPPCCWWKRNGSTLATLNHLAGRCVPSSCAKKAQLRVASARIQALLRSLDRHGEGGPGYSGLQPLLSLSWTPPASAWWTISTAYA